MWKWIYYNAPTIQAVSAFIGLIFLGVYAWDTRKIRLATLAQSTASRRPFLNIYQSEDTKVWRVINAGSGVAINVKWDYRIDSPLSAPLSLGAIAPTGHRALRIDRDPVETSQLIELRGIHITYADTAGQRYWTELAFQDFGQPLPSVAINTGDAS